MLVNEGNVSELREALDGGKSSGNFAPSVFVLEPNSDCNLSCIMCPNSKLTEAQLGRVSQKVWCDSLDAIAPYAELIMLYFMGESTLHPQFIELLEQARLRTSAKLVLSTNSFALTDPHLRAMLDYLDVVLVCIDRWDKKAYERIRRGSSFVDVIANAEKLLKRRGTASSPTIIVKTLDIKFPSDSRDSIMLEVEEFNSYWSKLGGIPLNGWLNSWAGQLVHISRLSNSDTPYNLATRQPCADLWFKMVINWKGEVVLCCHNYDYSVQLGDLTRSSPLEIWQSESLEELRRRHLERDFDVEICGSCREWGERDELEAYLTLDESGFFKIF